MFASTHVGRRFSYFNLQSSSSKYSEPDLVIFANWVERLDDNFATEILNDVLWCNDGKCCGCKSPATSLREIWEKNEKDSRGDSLKSRSPSKMKAVRSTPVVWIMTSILSNDGRDVRWKWDDEWIWNCPPCNAAANNGQIAGLILEGQLVESYFSYAIVNLILLISYLGRIAIWKMEVGLCRPMKAWW